MKPSLVCVCCQMHSIAHVCLPLCDCCFVVGLCLCHDGVQVCPSILFCSVGVLSYSYSSSRYGRPGALAAMGVMNPARRCQKCTVDHMPIASWHGHLACQLRNLSHGSPEPKDVAPRPFHLEAGTMAPRSSDETMCCDAPCVT